ncbi:MAG: hypothetical protein LW809_01820 [Vampirovibrionales bacterium]|jgi:hypothetical protein|nr:hypothetical protein [Vampirovibrionales bacterium]
MARKFEDKNSEITFGTFEEMNCVKLDDTILYNYISNKGISAVDFILYHTVNEDQQLDFIEAKRSVPGTGEALKIIQKFIDSLQLFIAYGFKRHKYCEDSPTLITQLDSSHLLNSEWRFVVICNNKKETDWDHARFLHAFWLEIREQYASNPFFKIWNIDEEAIKVLSVEMAAKQGLAVLPQGTPQ